MFDINLGRIHNGTNVRLAKIPVSVLHHYDCKITILLLILCMRSKSVLTLYLKLPCVLKDHERKRNLCVLQFFGEYFKTIFEW